MKRTAYIHAVGSDGGSTTITYDVSNAPNEELADMVNIGLNAHLYTHTDEGIDSLTITAKFIQVSA